MRKIMYKQIFMFLVMASSVHAQELKVKSMVMSANDSSVKEFERQDLNGEPCALIKVRLSSPGAIFEGNIIPPADYKEGEYWVYMTRGSQELRIKHPDYVPIHVTFADFDIMRGLNSSSTYILTLQMPEENVDDGLRYLRLKVTPTDSKVSVDGKLQNVDAEGVVSVKLPQGTHKYKVEAEGYFPQVGLVEMKDKSLTEMITLKPTAPVQLYNKEGIPYNTYKVGDVSFNMVRVEGGTFMMSDKKNKDIDGVRQPVHKVTLSTYYIGETEVTQGLWYAVMGGSFKDDKNFPIAEVSWDECQVFIQKLNQITGCQFRLPTEAEWEYAARGGNKSRGYRYSGSDSYDAVAWHCFNCKNAQIVGRRPANELGLYDMTGNVSEWCYDRHKPYQKEDQVNPKGPDTGNSRVYRGGSFKDGDGSGFTRTYEWTTTYRSGTSHDSGYYSIGLRLALVM